MREDLPACRSNRWGQDIVAPAPHGAAASNPSGNRETALGRALKSTGVSRDELFLTTKVWVANCSAARVMAPIDDSQERMGTDRVPLLLAHWPGDAVPVEVQVDGLNEVQVAGKTRFIGISNDKRSQLRAAIAASAAPIVTNQVEMHPSLDQSAMAALARHRHGADLLFRHGRWRLCREERSLPPWPSSDGHVDVQGGAVALPLQGGVVVICGPSPAVTRPASISAKPSRIRTKTDRPDAP